MVVRAFGIDISHHQLPKSLPWSRIKADCQFVICRATYGTKRDREVIEHVKRVRDAGCELGLYHFFRPTQAVSEQVEAFIATAEAVGFGPGDILPVFDVEDDLKTPISRSCDEAVHELADALDRVYGGSICYTSEYYWIKLGRPAWLLRYPLWIAQYTKAAMPRTPGGRPWLIWQYRVAPYLPHGPGGYDKDHPDLDQNVAAASLPKVPVIDAPEPEQDPQPVEVASLLPRQDENDGDDDSGPSWAELRARVASQQFDDVGIVRGESLRYDHDPKRKA